MPGPIFGHIPGYPVGSRFENRGELARAGVHRHTQAGIAGTAREGADSIVLSGCYEDDQDFGDEIVNTGYGGRDPQTKRQVSDQPFDSWNHALARSGLEGLPVRVVRGEGHRSPFLPKAVSATTGYSWSRSIGTRPGDRASAFGATGSASCQTNGLTRTRSIQARRTRRRPQTPLRGDRLEYSAS